MAGKSRKERVTAHKLSKKKKQQYMILFITFIFVFSGLYMGLGRSVPTEDEGPRTYDVVEYDSAQLGDAAAVVQVADATGDWIIMPREPQLLDQRDVVEVFESNITGVRHVRLEVSPGHTMFRLEGDGRNISGEVERIIRLPGGYNLYRVYRGVTPYGELPLVGAYLNAGDTVKAFVLRRSGPEGAELLAFSQGSVEEGPWVDAKVVLLDGLSVSGLSGIRYFEEDFKAVLNATEVRVNEYNETNASLWGLSFLLPADANTTEVESVLSAMNVSNITYELQGLAELPRDMILEGRLIQIPNNNMAPATFSYGRKVNDTVEVRVYFMDLMNQTIAFAIENSGNDTAAR